MGDKQGQAPDCGGTDCSQQRDPRFRAERGVANISYLGGRRLRFDSARIEFVILAGPAFVARHWLCPLDLRVSRRAVDQRAAIGAMQIRQLRRVGKPPPKVAAAITVAVLAVGEAGANLVAKSSHCQIE